MKKLIGMVVSGTLILLPVRARSQEEQEPWWQADPSVGGAETETAPPPAEAPAEVPPAPQAESVPAPQGYAQAATPAGQWVYTQQYGWIWMPYSDAFTYSPAGGYGEPVAYVYYPAYGWTWLAAPWVWGIGPWPFFGVYGPARFAWYGYGWWRYPSHWHYAPYRGSYYGVRPAPAYRGGAYGGYRPAPAYRGGAGYGGVRPAPYRGGSWSHGAAPAPAYRGGGFGPRAAPGGWGGSHAVPSRGWGHGGGAPAHGGAARGHGGNAGQGRGWHR